MKFATYCIGILLMAMSFSSFANVTRPENVNQEAIWLYTVNQNDSFEIIYKKYLNKRTNIAELAKYNQHKLTKKLQPGQVISIPVEMLKKIPTSVQVLLVYGDVLVTSALANEKRKANKGDFLTQGDALQTGKNSLAKLLFADGSNMDIQPNSNLSIQASYKYVGKETYVTHLKLVKGRTEVTANPEHVVGNTLQVETPSAIAAVRGTQFRVGAEGDIALQETLDGQVAFSAAENGVVQEVLIAKGYGSVAEKGKAPSPPIQLPDAPDVSALSKLIEKNVADFNLPQQQGVAVWVSQLALDAEFTQILNEQITPSGKLSFADLADGQYYLRIRAQDQYGLQGRDAIHAFNVKVRLPEPVLELIEPADGAVIPLAPTELSWTPIPAANSYTVQIARDTHFVDIVFERRVSFDKLTINQSFGAGEFYWRVAVLSDGKPQRFSEVRKFSR
ncbi:FecR domain-containing protein [Methylotenera sp.]|uniref:FecR domain-containing protein n=1 Tax=Methylotenera sp. TaxID=2051956 RepID=UPI002731F07A|nr:FecR domain-containing protein [Methylotenera sp.]MDP2072116.1 FecR domain-containing protein [Methylotenera sp.]MDP3006874.1 FecR domain-containing protein [Methylotenera sp.]MDP3007189.1 FecR domain-containing protein [Methylotenera sp.]